MKYRRVGIIAAVLMVLTVAAANVILAQTGEGSARVHQHLTARRDTGCDCDGSELCSHLPLVLIDTGGQTIPGEVTDERDSFGQTIHTMAEDGAATIQVSVAVIDNGDRNNHPSDTPDFTTQSEFRIRGNSSRSFPKLPYLLKFIDDAGEDRDIAVMGMGAHHEWALHAPILDKSLVRNYMWYNIAGEMMDYAPNCRYCELVLNGEYMGLYLMVETITNGDDCRLNLKTNVKNVQTTGYLLRIDRPTEADLESARDVYTFAERADRVQQDIAIRYPGKSTLTPELAKDIELDYSAFEKALFSYDHDTSEYGYWNWIDVDSFVDYFIIAEFTLNFDMGGYSTYIYKEVGEKYKLCVWDFNNACDNYQEQAMELDSFIMSDVAWYYMLMRDEEFVDLILNRYAELRQGVLSDEYLQNYIDETLEFLGPAVERNNARWADEIANWNGLAPEERNLHSHQEAVEQLKTWLTARGNWLDEHIDALQQYCHPSRNKKFNH